MGLLGGSYNPAHAGHRQVADLALRRLRLHEVWLMVSPGNPLKPRAGMAAFADRIASAHAIGSRRVVATGIEGHIRTRWTYDTLAALRVRFPRVRFVWLMGADNLEQLPRWQRWMDIVRAMPLAVAPRPTYNARALAGQAAQRMRRWLRLARAAPALAACRAPAWTFLPARQNPISATALRARVQIGPHPAMTPKPPAPPALLPKELPP